MADSAVIGIDGGTTAVKAVAFDLDGRVMTLAHRSIPVHYGKNGEAEQDANAIWDGVADCLTDVTDDLAGREILAVGLTGQGDGCWLFDENVTPLALMPTWMDGRAARRVPEWAADDRGAALAQTTGGAPFPGLAPVLLEYFKDTNPGHYSKARHLLYCKDWLRYRLTGNLSTDYTEASRTFLDVRTTEGYSTQLAEHLGMPEAVGLLPEIRKADDCGGRVTAEAAERTGIPEGTPVGVGMMDVAVTGVGLQATKSGDGWLILGTTGFIGRLSESMDQRESTASTILATGRGTQIIESMAPMTGTPNLDWIRRTLGLENTSWEEIEVLANEAGPGAGGVVYLPYASPGGERAPFLDPAASSSWLGMNLSTTPNHMLRAVYEGVAFSLAECIDALNMRESLVVSGGGFRSDLICQILADTTGQDVVRQDAPEAGARGAAVLALVSAGVDKDLDSAASALATGTDTFEPDADNSAIYQQAYRLFINTRKAIRPVWPEMRDLRANTGLEDT